MGKKLTYINKFTGLDQSADSADDTSLSPSMLNFRIDEKYMLRKRDGFITVAQLNSPVRAMWCGVLGGVKCLVYVSGGTVWKYLFSDNTSAACGSIADGLTSMFAFDGMLYIQNGVDYYRFDGTSVTAVEGYIPAIAVATAPSGAGTPYEQVNMLTDKRRQLFSSNFNDRLFKLAEKELDEILSVKVNGTATNQYDEDTAAGTVEFFAPPPAGVNNVEITYRKAHTMRSRITACTFSMLFGSNADTRVFMWGNTSYGAYRFHSELADGVPSAEYFPEFNFTAIGNSRITDIVQQYDRQLIFTPDSAYYSYCEVRANSAGTLYSSFPVFSLNSSKGNLLSASGCAIDGKPVTLCRDGLNIWESTDVENEKNAVCFSAPILNAIRAVQAADAFDACSLFDYQSTSELYFAYNGMMYIFNYRLGAWYVYDGIHASCFCDCYGDLYIGGSDYKIYRFDPSVKSHTAVWESSYLSFGEPDSRKDVISADMAVLAVPNTGLTLTWTDGEKHTVAGGAISFDAPDGSGQYLCARRLRTAMRRVQSAKLTVTCGAGKDLMLKSIGVVTSKKGGLSYGV